jgi:FkbM family methyltransferase
MKKITTILKEIYYLKWEGLNILECGAQKSGDETSDLESNNNCWYVEANPEDFKILQTKRKNTLNFALSNYDGTIKFTISSHPGNSSCEYSQTHLDELKLYNTSYREIIVNCFTYESLLKKLDIKFDIVVLDIEGHEVKVLETLKKLNKELLPNIFVIECGYDWEDRLKLLKQIGYKIDCYYFNNCFLSKLETLTNVNQTKIYNNQWKKFVWYNRTIYLNELI